MYQLPVNNLARIRRARKQVKRTLGDIGLELCKEAAEDFKEFCPDEQFVQGTLSLDISAWDPSYSKTQVYRSKPFCCTECSFSSKYYSGYKNHFRNVHRKIFDSILLNCPYCTFTASKRTMEVHIRIFHQSRLPQPSSGNALVQPPYATTQQSTFRRKDNAGFDKARQGTVHKAVYYCKKCTFRDSLYNVVRRHIYREHFQHVVSPYLAMASNSAVKNGVSSINGNTIFCKRCQFSTRSYEALVQHVVEYHERIGAQVTAMVGHANMVVGRSQASPVMSPKPPIIMKRAHSFPNDPEVPPVIGYLKPTATKIYSATAALKVLGSTGKSTLVDNNVPPNNTSQTQKWKICTVCNELFPENLYSAHFESAHKAKKVWALARYIMKIHNFTSKCLLCNRYLPSDTLLNHVLIHGLSCPQCNCAFHSVEKLIEHGNVAHMTPFDSHPGASPFTFDLALKQDKSSNVQLLVLPFNTNESASSQEETLLNSVPLAKLPALNIFEKKSQPPAKSIFSKPMSGKCEITKTLCPLCFTIIKGPLSEALALHLRQRHQVLQTMHPVEKKMTYKCIHCLGVYTSNMVASTITLHLVQCRAVGRSQAALALKSPLTPNASGAGLLKRQLPLQTTSNAKKIKLGKNSPATSQGQFDGLVLDPSNYEHKIYEGRKEFLTAYFNHRPYITAQEKDKLSSRLRLWKSDIATHFAVKQKLCERHCEKSKLSVLLGFDMNAVKKVKHNLIFGDELDASAVQKNNLPCAFNSDQKNSTLKPSVCMETISIDSDSEPETEDKPTANCSVDPNQETVTKPQTLTEITQEGAEIQIEAKTFKQPSTVEMDIVAVDDKPLPTKETQSEAEPLEQPNTDEMDIVAVDDKAVPTKEPQSEENILEQPNTDEMDIVSVDDKAVPTKEPQSEAETLEQPSTVEIDIVAEDDKSVMTKAIQSEAKTSNQERAEEMDVVDEDDKLVTADERHTVADKDYEMETLEDIENMDKPIIMVDGAAEKESTVNHLVIV